MTNEEILKKYLGIKYENRGRSLGGLDCWGLVLGLYGDLGFKLWDIDEPYEQDWSFCGKNFFIENYWRDWVEVVSPQRFDGALFRGRGGNINHAGVMLDHTRFIHCCKHGVIVSKLSDKEWKGRLEGVYRLKANL